MNKRQQRFAVEGGRRFDLLLLQRSGSLEQIDGKLKPEWIKRMLLAKFIIAGCGIMNENSIRSHFFDPPKGLRSKPTSKA